MKLLRIENLSAHNGATFHIGSPTVVELTGVDWANAVSLPFNRSAAAHFDEDRLVCVRITAEAFGGDVCVGGVTDDFAKLTTEEAIFTADAGPTTAEIEVPDIAATGHLVIRNAVVDGASPTLHITGVQVIVRDRPRHSLLTEVEVPPASFTAWNEGTIGTWHRLLRRFPARTSAVTFRLVVTHATRPWDAKRGDQDSIRERYARAGRLDALPPFETLRPVREHSPYAGRMTLFDVTLDAEGTATVATRSINSEKMISHAAAIDGALVLCVEDSLQVLPAIDAPLADGDGESTAVQIDDPWFAGLHTVFAAGPHRCLVSAAGPDAVLTVDLAARRVVERWRLPDDVYGSNYDLTPEMSVRDHYIPNDIQLGHLNGAFPAPDGGFWVSTLGQGDIARAHPGGRFERLYSGVVGCHGVRSDRSKLSFVDTCNGRLMELDAEGRVRVLASVESRWLHDAQPLIGGLFALLLADHNALALVDTATGHEFARVDMSGRGRSVLFAGLIDVSTRS